MNGPGFLSSLLGLPIAFFILMSGCSQPILKMPESLPPIIKEYKHVTLRRNGPYLVNTGIHLDKGETYSILLDRPDWRNSLSLRIGEQNYYASAYAYHGTAVLSGDLRLHLHFRNFSWKVNFRPLRWL